MWTLVFVYFFEVTPFVELVSVHRSMNECFQGRGRTYTIWRDEKGNAHKVQLDPNDPGGEHE